MKTFFARVKRALGRKASVANKPLSEKELKREAAKFAETYADVLKKLAKE